MGEQNAERCRAFVQWTLAFETLNPLRREVVRVDQESWNPFVQTTCLGE